MSNELDLNIDHYTVDELVQLLRIKTPITQNDVNSKLTHIIDKYSANRNSFDRNSATNEYVVFFEKARDKLLCKNRFANVPNTVVVGTQNTVAPPLLPYTYNTSTLKTTEFNKLVNDTVDDLGQNIDTTTIKKNGPRNIITHPNLDAVPTYNQEVVAGTLNPLKRRIIKKSLLIDTRFREMIKSDKKDKHGDQDKHDDENDPCVDNTINTNFSIQLPNTICNVISMKLTSLEFPSTWYVFSKGLKTNIMTIIFNGVSHEVNIKPGNYNPYELMEYLNGTPAPPAAPLPPGITVEFNEMYGKFTFKITSPAPGDTLELDFRVPTDKTRNIKFNMGWILGFRKSFYKNKTTYEPEGIFDSTGFPYIYLIVDDFQNNVENNFIGAFEESIKKSCILARIPQPAPLGGIMFDDSSDLVLKKRTYFGPVNIDRLKFQILDQYHRIIDINNMDWSMALELECVYNL